MDLSRIAWRKASYSGNGGDCVEVGTAERVAVRHSEDSQGPKLAFTPDAWRAFIRRVKA